MKFKMNNREWEIKEVNQDKMRELENDDDKRNTYYGLTTYENQTIWIWEDLHPNQKRQTLIHELFHCYVGCYYSFQETVYTEELVCNLVGNSHDIIHKIVKEYFEEAEREDIERKYSCKSNTEILNSIQDEGWKEMTL